MLKQKYSRIIVILVLSLFSISGVVARPHAATSPTLLAAGSYSVLAGSEVTNTGATTLPGDLGISPGIGPLPHYSGLGTAVIGPPGSIHDADTNAGDAQADNTAAFTFLDQPCDITYAGAFKDLVGENLVAGVYCADAFRLSGTLTLSGAGVWIFKSAADLITSGTANVVGGDACNVWWRQVSSATLGTNTSLIGNVLSSTAIVMQTGATLTGRVMAQTAAVTLDSNTISDGGCLTASTAGGAGGGGGGGGGGVAGTTGSTSADDDESDGNAILGLPDTGGAPIRQEVPTELITVAAVAGVLVVALGVRAYRRPQ
jgi:hypothetical protein